MTADRKSTSDFRDDITDDIFYDDGLVQSILATAVVTLDTVAATTINTDFQDVMWNVRQGWPAAKSEDPAGSIASVSQLAGRAVYRFRCLMRGCLVIIPPSGLWRKLSLDIAGEFVVAPPAHRYMLVAIDYFSKWPEYRTVEYVTSSAVINFLTMLFWLLTMDLSSA